MFAAGIPCASVHGQPTCWHAAVAGVGRARRVAAQRVVRFLRDEMKHIDAVRSAKTHTRDRFDSGVHVTRRMRILAVPVLGTGTVVSGVTG